MVWRGFSACWDRVWCFIYSSMQACGGGQGVRDPRAVLSCKPHTDLVGLVIGRARAPTPSSQNDILNPPQGWGCTGLCCSPSWGQVGQWLSHGVGTGWGTTGLSPSVHGQQGLVAKPWSKPSSVIVWKPAWLRIRAQPGPGCTHTFPLLPSLAWSLPGTFLFPHHFCSTASTCPHSPDPGLKTKQGWRGKKGQMDSTLLLKAWSNLHCYNSSSWDSQKNTFKISFFSPLFPLRHFSLSWGEH